MAKPLIIHAFSTPSVARFRPHFVLESALCCTPFLARENIELGMLDQECRPARKYVQTAEGHGHGDARQPTKAATGGRAASSGLLDRSLGALAEVPAGLGGLKP
jgi:hypothetical protein